MVTTHIPPPGGKPSDDVQHWLQGRAPLKLLIDGEWTEAQGGETFASYNPATGQVLATVSYAGAADVARAVAAAGRAFPAWRATTPKSRQRLLLRLADVIEENAEQLAQLETLDNGLPIAQNRIGMSDRVPAHLRYYAGLATSIAGETLMPSVAGSFHAYTVAEPVGIAGLIVPWNAPMIYYAWKLGPALAAGCTVVVKPAEETPVTAVRLGELIEEAGFPPGVVNIVQGPGAITGAALAASPDVDKVAFTGSTDTGRKIVEASSRTLKRVQLELGGKSAAVILPDADLETAIPGIAWGFSRSTGQLCCASTRLLIHKAIYDEVISRLTTFVDRLTVGNGLDPRSDLGPVVSETQYARVEAMIDAGREDGLRLVTRTDGSLADRPGYFIRPTVFADVDNSARLAQEEIFGPVACAIPVDDLQDAVHIANDSPYGLAASVWTTNISSAIRFTQAVRVGTAWVNSHNTLDVAVPFGGLKDSGYGKDQGIDALAEYIHKKSVWMQY